MNTKYTQQVRTATEWFNENPEYTAAVTTLLERVGKALDAGLYEAASENAARAVVVFKKAFGEGRPTPAQRARRSRAVGEARVVRTVTKEDAERDNKYAVGFHHEAVATWNSEHKAGARQWVEEVAHFAGVTATVEV